MSTSASNKVMFGPYVGKTRVEMRALLIDAQAELADGAGTITSASINGQSFTRTGPSVYQRIRLIQQALSQVDPDFIAPRHTIAVRFGGPS